MSISNERRKKVPHRVASAHFKYTSDFRCGCCLAISKKYLMITSRLTAIIKFSTQLHEY
jgi:hypothetical protein